MSGPTGDLGEDPRGPELAALLERWATGDLDPAGRARLIAGLADGAAAAALVEELRLDGLLRDGLRLRASTAARRTVRGVFGAALAAAALVVASAAWWLFRAPELGRLVAAEGVVTVAHAGRPVAEPSALRDGDRIAVGDAGEAMVRLLDGSEITLAGGTVLTLRAQGAAVLGELDAGSLVAAVRPRPSDGPLRLITATATATVLGTRFRLSHADAATRLEVVEGHVRLERRSDGVAVVVGPGEVATAAPGRDLAAERSYAAPIRITAGGTYRGAWESTDAAVPAVTVATTEPVIIERSYLRGAGDLVRVDAGGDIVLRDCRAIGIPPDRRGGTQGKLLLADRPRRAVVEHNEVLGTTGIFLTHAAAGAGLPIAVIANRFRNLDSRSSDGAGGWLGPGGHAGQANLVSLYQMPAVAGVEIAWNEVDDEPGRSLVANLVSLWQTGGTAERPILIHDNCLRGTYWDASDDQDFAGSGIAVGAGGELDGVNPGFVRIVDNQLIATVHAGIVVYGGHDHEVVGNRAISSGLTPGGDRILCQDAGIILEDGGSPQAGHAANVARDNLSGWVRWNADGSSARADYRLPPEHAGSGNGEFPAATLADEAAEWRRWQDKVRERGVTIGPRP